MRNRLMRTMIALVCAVVLHVPVSAFAEGFSVDRVSSNFALVSISDTELVRRRITTIALGEIELTSGRIVATDPLSQPDRGPFLRTVPVGRYPVTLYQAQGRIAAASMTFSDERSVRWELAVMEGQKPSDLKGGEFFGIPVDAGLGAYMDADAFSAIQWRETLERARRPGKDFDYYNQVLHHELGENGNDFVLHRPIADRRGNVAIFSSGWGDGYYPVFWGLDDKDRPAAMLTDFLVIENADGRREAGSE